MLIPLTHSMSSNRIFSYTLYKIILLQYIANYIQSMSLSLWQPKCAWMEYTYNKVRMIIVQIREIRKIIIPDCNLLIHEVFQVCSWNLFISFHYRWNRFIDCSWMFKNGRLIYHVYNDYATQQSPYLGNVNQTKTCFLVVRKRSKIVVERNNSLRHEHQVFLFCLYSTMSMCFHYFASFFS